MMARRLAVAWLLVSASAAGACQLQRPNVEPVRMIEPELVTPPAREGLGGPFVPVRLLDTQARSHIGRRLLHLEAGPELVEDPIFRWTASPDRYLDSALRLAFEASRELRLVDKVGVPTVAVTLVTWHIESAAGRRLAGAIETVITDGDRAVTTRIEKATEPVAAELPGDLGGAAGRLLNTLASGCLAQITQAIQPRAPAVAARTRRLAHPSYDIEVP
jgi:hypothetical protein